MMGISALMVGIRSIVSDNTPDPKPLFPSN
jgi:hypothetical protein